MPVLPCNRPDIRVKVQRQTAQPRNLVQRLLGVVDEGLDPVLVGGDGDELGQGDSDGERVVGCAELVLVPEVDVADRHLEVVDDVGDHARHQTLVLLLVLASASSVRDLTLDVERFRGFETLLLGGLISPVLLSRLGLSSVITIEMR